MSLTDPIADLLTCIRNATQAKMETLEVPASKLSERILEIFKTDEYIEDFRPLKDNKQGKLKIYLKPAKEQRPAIIGIKKISKPGLRVYVKGNSIPRVLNGLGTAVISTSKGVLSDKDARSQKVGGEVLCYIW